MVLSEIIIVPVAEVKVIAELPTKNSDVTSFLKLTFVYGEGKCQTTVLCFLDKPWKFSPLCSN